MNKKITQLKNGQILLVLAILLFVAGGCSKLTGGKDETKDVNPTPITQTDNDGDENESDGKFSDVKGKTTFGKAIIKNLRGRDSKIGEFQLIGINTKDSVSFKKALETVTAVYKNETSGDSVVHSSSIYMDWDELEEVALKLLDSFEKVDKKIATRKSDGNITSIFKGKNRTFYMACKKSGKLGVCQLISSDKPKALKDYTNTFFGLS